MFTLPGALWVALVRAQIRKERQSIDQPYLQLHAPSLEDPTAVSFFSKKISKHTHTHRVGNKAYIAVNDNSAKN